MASFLVGWAVASALYVLFAGQFSADELVAAILFGLTASLWAGSLRRAVDQRFHFSRGTWGAVWRAIAGLPAATARVALALLRAAALGGGGALQSQPFVHGRKTNPGDAGRRAVAVLARSLAPDSFVVRAPEGEDKLDVHALVKTSEGNPQWAV